MKNNIRYPGGASGSSITENDVKTLIQNELKNLVVEVDLGTVDYSIPASKCVDIQIPYTGKVPDGYTVIGFSDFDLSHGGNCDFTIKRICAYETDYAYIAVTNSTASTVTGKLWARVICVKSSIHKSIT